MSYIGKEPVVGNFQVCDAITVVNGQAAYSLTVGSAAVSPESANHMLVSLNGVLQKPGSSFTISGSTMTFASNLATGDVIDFVQILGNVLDLGQPSDDTVKTASLQANAVTGAKLNTDVISAQTALASAPADTDEFLVSDAGTLKRIDYSLIKGGGMWEFISQTNVTSAVDQVDFTSLSSDFTDFCIVINDFHNATDNAELYMRFFEGTSGGSDIAASTVYQWTFIGADTGDTQTDSNGSNDTLMRLGRPIGAASQELAQFEVTIYNPHNTTDFKLMTYSQTYLNAAGEAGVVRGTGASYHGVGSDYTVTGCRFYMQSGQISSGKFNLYGRKHS
jgi:hypothetical protein